VADPVDIEALVPAVTRALGTVGITGLTDPEIYGLTADALADVSLYTGSVFGTTLEVTERDPDTNAPTKYATGRELTLQETAVIRAQAALNRLFVVLRDEKISERLADEAQEWEWARSAQLLRDQLNLLIAERDRALEALMAQGAALDSYDSFIHVQDRWVSCRIEPWVENPSADANTPFYADRVGL
jgi:hypothetical protein